MHRARSGKPIANTLRAFPFSISRTTNYFHRMLKVSCHKPAISLGRHTHSLHIYFFIVFFWFFDITYVCLLASTETMGKFSHSVLFLKIYISFFAKVPLPLNYVSFFYMDGKMFNIYLKVKFEASILKEKWWNFECLKVRVFGENRS